LNAFDPHVLEWNKIKLFTPIDFNTCGLR
jgi:hypothetical protein